MNLTRRRRNQRLTAALMLLLGSALVAVLLGVALGDNLNKFIAPSEASARALEPGERLTVGGVVAQGSVVFNAERSGLSFILTDEEGGQIAVTYGRIPPDLFAEGRGAIAAGRWLGEGRMEAINVMAKHDESYVPRTLERLEAEQSASYGQ